MTEAEWLACQDPEAMLRFIARYTSRRKERLFAVACCRRLDHLLDNYCRELLDRVEASTDHQLSVTESEELINDVMTHADGLSYRMGTPTGSARWLAGTAVWQAAEDRAILAAGEAADAVTTSKLDPATNMVAPDAPTIKDAAECAAQADILRDIVWNPFRSVVIDSAWRTSTVRAVAARMYESREFSAMPILADALQDAGCENGDVLTHCRARTEHVRGCWVVDLLLGKL